MTQSEFIKMIEEMTAEELKELVDLLEERLGLKPKTDIKV